MYIKETNKQAEGNEKTKQTNNIVILLTQHSQLTCKIMHVPKNGLLVAEVNDLVLSKVKVKVTRLDLARFTV
jgi:hypothetical protein